MKSALSALHGVPDLSQLPGEHYRGAVITNDVSLYHTAYSRVLVLHMSGVRKVHVKSLSQGLNVDLA